MTLRNRHGQESERLVTTKNLEVEGDGDKAINVFQHPLDVKGTALLSFSHKVGSDDQWLYLPALKRVKRISSANKSGPFMGSEFAYEDVTSQEIEKYAHKYVREESYEGQPCFVIERDPVDPKSGYKRQLVWFDQEHYRPLRIEFYDRKNDLLKILTYSAYQQYLGRYWRADEMFMENRQNGKSTLLVWTDYQFSLGLADKDFSQAALRRAR